MAVDGRLNFDTKIDTKGFVSGTKNISENLSGLKSMLNKVAVAATAAFSVTRIVNFGKESVSAANKTSNAMQGLKSIMDGQGRSYSQATKWIQDYVSDGLIPLQNAVTAYKNLASRGYDDSQIQSVLTALKDSSAYGRQASLSMGDAVQTATEGLKNENSVLVDNAGVTKNVSQMWNDYAKSIGTTSSNLTQEQKIQAEVNGILAETRFQTGDAAKVANSFSGQLSKLTFNFNELKVAVGNILTNVLTPVVTYLNTAIVKITQFAKSISKALGITSNVSSSNIGIVDSSSDLMSNASEAATSYDSMADSAEAAKKANERQLASFDKITKLTDNTTENQNKQNSTNPSNIGISNGTIKSQIDIDTSETTTKLKKLFNDIKSVLNRLFDPIKQAWEKTGAKVIASIKYAFKSIKDLIKSIGDSFEEVWENGTGERFITNLLILFSDIQNIIGDIATALKNAWNENGRGEQLIQSIFNLLNSVLEIIHLIASDFREVWNNGTGIEVCSHIFNIITNINNIVTNLVNSFRRAWEENDTGKKIIQDVFDILNRILGTIENVTQTTVEWAKQLDFTPLLESINVLFKSVEPLSKNIGEGLEWFWNNVLLPIASWTIENAVPSFLNLLSNAIDVLNDIITAFKPLGQWLWDNFIKPMASDIAFAVISDINDLSNALKKVGDWIIEHKTAVENIAIAIGIMGAAFKIASIVNAASTALAAAGGVMGILTPITTALGTAINFLTSPITLVILAIGALIAIGVLLYKNWDTVKEKLSAIWEAIKSAVSTVVDAIKGFFVGLWDSIKSIFTTVIDWVKTNWKTIILFITNPVAGVFKYLYDHFEGFRNVVNTVIEAIKGFFVGLWNKITSIFSSIGSWFKGVFTGAWNGIKNVFSKVGDFFSSVWSAIKKPFTAVADWFKDIFSKAWGKVQDVFSSGGKMFKGIKEGISSVFTTVVNKLLDGINWVIRKPLEFLNGVLNDIHDISLFGHTPFDGFWEYDPIPIPQIPKLATGTVVPANCGEFLAVLGDNKRETEVVSPLSTMKQAVKEAISESGYGGGDIVIHYTAELDGQQLHKKMVRINKQEIRKTGKNPMLVTV